VGLPVKIRQIVRQIAALMAMQMSLSILQTQSLALLLFTLITAVGPTMFRQEM
jgi:hypothetical protein